MLECRGENMTRVSKRFVMTESRELEAKGRAGGTWNEEQHMDALRCRRMDMMDW